MPGDKFKKKKKQTKSAISPPYLNSKWVGYVWCGKE